MPFQLGDIKIKGTIDDISFYPSVFGWLVRRKGGPSSKQYKTSLAFERSRENNSEFTNCSKSASLIRHLVIKHTGQKDKSLYHRLTKLVRLLANDDKTSVRGKRDPLKGLQTQAGQARLREFEISAALTLFDILQAIAFIPTQGSNQSADLQRNETKSELKRRKTKRKVYRFQSAEQRFLSNQIGSIQKPFLGWKHVTINTSFG